MANYNCVLLFCSCKRKKKYTYTVYISTLKTLCLPLLQDTTIRRSPIPSCFFFYVYWQIANLLLHWHNNNRTVPFSGAVLFCNVFCLFCCVMSACSTCVVKLTANVFIHPSASINTDKSTPEALMCPKHARPISSEALHPAWALWKKRTPCLLLDEQTSLKNCQKLLAITDLSGTDCCFRGKGFEPLTLKHPAMCQAGCLWHLQKLESVSHT